MLDLDSDSATFLSDFGEAITYTPQGQTGLSRTAIIERSPMRVTPAGGRQVAQGIVEIWMANDTTLGVASVKERFDKVSLPEKIGGSNKTYTVMKILEQDAGFWHLECGG